MSFKDLPEGQTHSMNDGCGEPAHNPTLRSRIEEILKTANESCCGCPVGTKEVDALLSLLQEVRRGDREKLKEAMVKSTMPPDACLLDCCKCPPKMFSAFDQTAEKLDIV